MDDITDDMNILDWSKLDPIVNKMSSGLGGSISMYGSFDFDAEYQVQASQRQRQTRRRPDVGAEKKPTVVSLSIDIDLMTINLGGSTVESILFFFNLSLFLD